MNINKKIFIYLGLFLFCLISFPRITQAIDIPASASRTSGVAPLSVHFNADLTASSPTERSFHDLEYSWNFGDTNAGNWGTDNRPKNQDKGPVAAHVYETPGTFTATLTVRNEIGIIDTKYFEITVADPEVVFSGTKTTCISTNTDFTGCPNGATQIPNVSASLATILPGYADAGERVLLRRGSSWSMNTVPDWNNNSGPVHIGAFGTCNLPDSQGICSNAPAITVNTADEAFLPLSGKADWRLTNIAFSANKGNGYVTSTFTKSLNHLIYKIKATGFESPLFMTSWRNSDADVIENIAFIDNHSSGTYSWCAYVGGEGLMFMGNITENSDNSHVLRIWLAYKGIISHNIVSGSGLTYGGRNTMKFFGPSSDPSDLGGIVGDFATSGATGMRNRTEFAVVSNNLFGGGGPWSINMGPEDDQSVENLSDIIFEKNKVIVDYGIQNSAEIQISVTAEGRYFTLRNNIINGATGYAGYIGIYIGRRGEEWTPLGNEVYNNTIYSPTNHTEAAWAISVHPDADDTVIRNNLASFPNTGSDVMVENLAGAETTISNNLLTNTPYFVDPENVSPLLRNFSLTSNSTDAINQGVIVSVFDDFTNQSRLGVYDIGAYEYISGGDTIAPSAPLNPRVL